MNIKADYYLNKYEYLKVLSDTEKCKTILTRNVDTGELAIQKETTKEAYPIYNTLKGLNNNNLPQVLDCFIIEEKCISIEHYIDGKRLESIIKEDYLSAEKAIHYTIQLCHALATLHEMGIIHRDIQPKNVIITPEDTLKLIDFDIAREKKDDAKRDTSLFGTAGYASPEQYGFAQTDGRSDIYSVGILLREMLTGSISGTDEEIVRKIKKENETGSCFITAEKLTAIIHKCTSIDANNRYENVIALENALNECIKQSRPDSNERRDFSYKDYNENMIQKKKESELLPLTAKNIFHSIPGYGKKNYLSYCLATIIYGMFIYMSIDIGLENGQTLFKKIIIIIGYLCLFFIPYIYLVNIGQIMYRFPKIKYKNKDIRVFFQIIYAIILFFLIALLIGIMIPEFHQVE